MNIVEDFFFRTFQPFEDDLIRKYLYDSYPLTVDGTVDRLSCFATCIIAASKCGVIVVHDEICYIGNFEEDDRGVITTALFEEVYINWKEREY